MKHVPFSLISCESYIGMRDSPPLSSSLPEACLNPNVWILQTTNFKLFSNKERQHPYPLIEILNVYHLSWSSEKIELMSQINDLGTEHNAAYEETNNVKKNIWAR